MVSPGDEAISILSFVDNACGEGGQRKLAVLVALVLDLAMASERVSLPVLCGLGRHTSMLPKGFYVCCAAALSISGEYSLKDEPLQTTTAVLPGSKWSCLLLRHCAAGRIE